MGDYYIGLDGDSIGRIIESFLISGEETKVVKFSQSISVVLDEIKTRVLELNGRVLFCSGDSILFYGKFDKSFCNSLLTSFKTKTNCSASIGIGKTLPEVYLGLKLAKSRGGNQAVVYPIEL